MAKAAGAGHRPYSVLIVANIIYATSYVATRATLAGMPPATLAFMRLILGGLAMAPLIRRKAMEAPPQKRDRWIIAWMGIMGFGAAFLLANWGISASTATNAALLIVVEPISLMLLGPLLLGEQFSPREAAGAALAVAGALLVIVNGVPGFSRHLAPHWRGDILLVLSGLAYASYSLLGRRVLGRYAPERVTLVSIFWGAAVLLPFALAEWTRGQRPVWAWPVVMGTLYLAVVVTALGFYLWNWALERMEAARAAIFLNIQPAVGALLGVTLLGEHLTSFIMLGAIAIVAGLTLAFWSPKRVV